MADIEINLESTDPKELLRSGHHAFIMKDFANAAAAMGKATQLMAQEHGDEHDSLGEIYLHYARALLEVSRDEAEPLGDAIPHGDSDSDSSQEDDGTENENETDADAKESSTDEKSEDKEKEAEQNGDAKEESKEDESKEEKTDTEKTNGTTNGDAATSSTSNGEAAATSSTNGEGEETTEESAEKDEPTDLQLAWEVLEVAKKIFTARGDSGKELLSQSLILLGEVGMESENFADAAKDMQAGLELQETLYEKTSRKLAETQYKLGIAHATLSNIEDAVKYFDMSITTLNERIGLLKEKDTESNKKEILEIEELIPEIKEKINDTKSIKDETVKLIMEMTGAATAEPTEVATSSTKEVKDISHLVKRKRKIEESPEVKEAQPSKKPTP